MKSGSTTATLILSRFFVADLAVAPAATRAVAAGLALEETAAVDARLPLPVLVVAVPAAAAAVGAVAAALAPALQAR